MVSELQTNKMSKNGKLIAFYLLQFSFLVPFMQLVNSTVLVAISSLSLIAVLLTTNINLRINPKVLFLYICLTTLFLLKYSRHQAELSAIVYLLLFTLPAGCMFMFPFNYDAFIIAFTKYSRVCFTLLFWIPFTPVYSYMRFGYGLLPIIMAAYISIFCSNHSAFHTKKYKQERLCDIAILFIGTIELVVYGARGATFSFLLFVVIERLLLNKSVSFSKIVTLFVGLLAAFNIVGLLTIAESFAERIGIYSYPITKFRMQLSGGFAYASSGRMHLYNDALNIIKDHPLSGGLISLDESGGNYVHNLFLQVAEDLGMIALIILFVFLLYVLKLVASSRVVRSQRIILTILFSISVGRLMFSSTLWRRPEFWMMVCFVLSMKMNYKYNKKGATNITWEAEQK